MLSEQLRLGAQAHWRGMGEEALSVMGPGWPYPQVRFRPELRGDDKNPEFSTCTLPVVYYKAHEDNFWHALIGILPQVVGFLLEGQANRDITYVVRIPNNASGRELVSYRSM